MDSTKAQDITRHIFKDEDKGCEYIKNLALSDSVEVLTKIIPALINEAEEKKNVNDAGYFSWLNDLYRKIVIEKLMNAEHLWTIYCDNTGYPYVVDNDIIVLYDYANHLKVEERLKKYGFSISFGIEDGQGIMSEVGHMYRNGIKNIRFIDGRDNMLTISREEIATYDMFFKDEYVTNPALQNALISFFQEFRKDKVDDNSPVLASKETDLKVALRNADFMVPCTKEETDDSVSIAHPYVDITDKVEHKEGEQVLALPVFTDGIELDKCYFDKHENMLYTYMELLKSVTEIGASGIVINPLGVSYYVPLDIMKKIIAD